MSTVISNIVAKTSAGVPIRSFENMELAEAWAQSEGDRFSGWYIQVETVRVITTTAIPLWDRELAA